MFNFELGGGCPLGSLAWLLLLAFLLLVYVLWDVNYFVRIIYTVGTARFFGARKKITDTTKIKGFCTTNDVDIFLRHMNNARYVRELDFARFHYYETTGLYNEIQKAKGFAMQSASFIRYRRSIPIFTSYHVTTKLIWWDDKALYLEQQFVSPDGFVRACVLSKQAVVLPKTGKYENFEKLVEDYLRKQGVDPVKPPISDELKHLCDCIEISSAKLRKRE